MSAAMALPDDGGDLDGKRGSIMKGKNTGKAIKMAKGGIKNATALPGSAVKGVGNAAKFGVNATTFVAKGATQGAGKAAKVGVKSTITGAKMGVKGTLAGAKMGVKGTLAGAKLGVKGTLAGAKLGVKGTMATAKGTVGVGKLVAKGGVGLVTDFPGTAINLVGNTVKGAVGLPGTLTNLARRRVARDNRLAWETRLTSPVIKVDLFVECRNLPPKNSFASADSFAVIWKVKNGYTGAGANSDTPSSLPTKQEVEIGKTEVVRGNNSPKFDNSFRLNFNFEEEQSYLVRIYDEDLQYNTDLREHDYLGGVVFTLGQLMGCPGSTLACGLGNGSGRSQLFIMGREITEAREVVSLRFSAQDLPNFEQSLDKNDPYFKIERLEEDGITWETVFKSEVIMDNECPTWALVRLPIPQLCHGDMFNQIRLTLFDWNKFQDDNQLGFVATTVRNLVHGSEHGIPVFNVWREHKKLFRGSKQRKAGTLKVLKAHIEEIPSMLQYISGGMEIDLTIAVDCSLNNGARTEDTQGLHTRSNQYLNDYQAAIDKVGIIMESYSKDKIFNIWGFGAAFNGDEKPIFPLGSGAGVGALGLLELYNEFFGDEPTHEPGEVPILKPTIIKAMYRAIEQSHVRHSYSVLCILTAGNVLDMQKTVDCLCTAAEDAPLSVIIIGVGEGDFSTFKGLFEEGSAKLQHSNGVPISRDIASFASFFDFNDSCSEVVAKALAQMPEQFVQYEYNSGVKPRPPVPAPDLEKNLRKSIRKSRKKSTKRSKNGYST